MKLRILLLCLIFLSAPLWLSARTITFDDLYSIPSCSDPQISPDGRRIVFVLETSDPVAGSEERHLWVMNNDGTSSRQLTFGAAGEWQPRWSGDGRTILFLSDREEGTQVWLLPLDGGEARRVTSLPTSVAEFECFPASRKILLVSRVFPDCASDSCNKAALEQEERDSEKPRLYDRLLYRHYNRWDDGRVKRLFMYDLADSVLAEVSPSPFDTPTDLLGGYRDYAVSPDGAEICFAQSRDSLPAVRVNNDLYLVPAGGGKTVPFTDGPGLESTPRYSPDGRYLSYLVAARAGYESDQRDLVVYERSAKTHVNLSDKFDRSIGDYLWDSESRYIYLTALDRGFRKVWRLEIRTGIIEGLLDDAVYYDLRISPDGRFLVLNRSLSDQPYELFRFDLQKRRLTRLTHFSTDVVDDLDMNRAEEFWFVGAVGDSVHGFLTRPPDFDANRQYPLLLMIHGGPQWTWLGDFQYYGWNMQLMAAQGYVVAQIDPHGSAGYGIEFQDYVSGNWGKGDYEDIMKGVDFLISQYPFIDSSRMAALGRSYGGFMVNWICGHTDRFRCLVSVDGTFNHVSDYGSTDELWFPEWEYRGTPWSNRDEYVRTSPATYAPNFRTPTMVIHGQKDYRVDLSEGLQMFTALQRMHVPSQLLYFPDESHSVAKLKNLRIVYEKQFEWLARWLKP